MMNDNSNDSSIKKTKENIEIKNYSFKNIIIEKENTKVSKKIKYNQSENKFLKINNFYKYNLYILLFPFICIYSLTCQLKTKNLRKLESSAEITITIKGDGTQKIKSDFYSSFPDIVLVNGNSYTSAETIELVGEENNITLKWNSDLTDCQQMFWGLGNIKNVDLTQFNALNVVNMSHMFRECSSLETVEISDFNSPNLIDMNHMFYGCSSLKSIDFKNINTEHVTDMNNMFYDCLQLTSIGISNFNTNSVINFNYMFYNCIKLTSLNLNNFYTSSAVYMNYMFHYV